MNTNKFADLTSAEFSHMFLGFAKTSNANNVVTLNENVADSVDWRTGATVAVNAIKD